VRVSRREAARLRLVAGGMRAFQFTFNDPAAAYHRRGGLRLSSERGRHRLGSSTTAEVPLAGHLAGLPAPGRLRELRVGRRHAGLVSGSLFRSLVNNPGRQVATGPFLPPAVRAAAFPWPLVYPALPSPTRRRRVSPCWASAAGLQRAIVGPAQRAFRPMDAGLPTWLPTNAPNKTTAPVVEIPHEDAFTVAAYFLGATPGRNSTRAIRSPTPGASKKAAGPPASVTSRSRTTCPFLPARSPSTRYRPPGTL
jgi:hypothetical protein